MNTAQFHGVHILIWDFDGTLTPPNAAFNSRIIEADYQVVMAHRGWTHEKTAAEFAKIYNVTTPSSTQTAAKLAGISVKEAAIECEQYKDRTAFLSADPHLQSLFTALSGYTHYMLANGARDKLIEALGVLGIPVSTFAEIITAETVGVTKPDPKGFTYIMQKTGLSPEAHLMIGDREAVDLIPAKALGMHTCLVWSETNSTVADVTVPTVYDLEPLLV
jgi:HAD superfamily hydrolase (TIGR01549 family)